MDEAEEVVTVDALTGTEMVEEAAIEVDASMTAIATEMCNEVEEVEEEVGAEMAEIGAVMEIGEEEIGSSRVKRGEDHMIVMEEVAVVVAEAEGETDMSNKTNVPEQMEMKTQNSKIK